MAEALGTLGEAPDARTAAEAALLAAARAYALATRAGDAHAFNKAKAELLAAALDVGEG